MSAIYLPGPTKSAPSVNISPNYTQSSVANGAGDVTLTAGTVQAGSNFLSLVAINPTNTIFTITIGGGTSSVVTVPAQATVSIDIVASVIVMHATAANQEVVCAQYNPATT